MKELMKDFRKGLDQIAGRKVTQMSDFAEGFNGLPKADVLKYNLDDGSNVIIRPSGTEPKIKVYITAGGADADAAKQAGADILEDIRTKM